jgi:hypothetical protein
MRIHSNATIDHAHSAPAESPRSSLATTAKTGGTAMTTAAMVVARTTVVVAPRYST